MCHCVLLLIMVAVSSAIKYSYDTPSQYFLLTVPLLLYSCIDSQGRFVDCVCFPLVLLAVFVIRLISNICICVCLIFFLRLVIEIFAFV